MLRARAFAVARAARARALPAQIRQPLLTAYRFQSTVPITEPAQTDALAKLDTYLRRHNGSCKPSDIETMLATTGHKSVDSFVKDVFPEDVLVRRPMQITPREGFTESELLARIQQIGAKNKILRSYIGRGYYGTFTPAAIQRNILENPQWYTSYTPYQPEISQGRLESLFNYQTMVAELTGMAIANASLLDEGTAAAEAMIMSFVATNKKKPVFYVHEQVYEQTLAVLRTRAAGLGIDIKIGLPQSGDYSNSCGVLLQYPAADGSVGQWKQVSEAVHSAGGTVCVATDLLALTLLEPPSTFGADIVLGSAQRFGVPMGYGGPHAAFFATTDGAKRKLPGRVVGSSVDRLGNRAFRLALQTREQHIRREKATSNICTAQALLANMSAMYAVYHGPEGLKQIAQRVYSLTTHLAGVIKASDNFSLVNESWFDTLTVNVGDADVFMRNALDLGINVFRSNDSHIAISLDETIGETDFAELCGLFGGSAPSKVDIVDVPNPRSSPFLQQKVFNSYHSETELLRYMNHLQTKDLSLATSMIPLGSCTMKLNATVQMMPVSMPEFGQLHPFVPLDQAEGYKELIKELEEDLAEITGFAGTSLQPNSGAQGEFTGLRVIQAYHQANGQGHRNICLIPVSAHGTNPASAVMSGMKVVPVKTTHSGELDMEDLEAKAIKHKDNLAAVMITYPSTFGCFEPGVRRAIDIVHSNGGQVYLDGANMNAQIGLTSPGDLGADVCHLNLHKTFCIPHGGGGPGVGPICAQKHLVPFLPGHSVVNMFDATPKAIDSVSAAPWGSASILCIPWAYIKMMGSKGLTSATELALLNANYMKDRLSPHYKILYTNSQNRCAHEFILDMRPFKAAGIEVIDIAKRLQDYGFHAPTMSWPTAGTLMVEPTESESKAELDRFCDALIAIRQEIRDVEENKVPYANGVLANAPHTQADLLRSDWDREYSRETAAYPLEYLRERKFWPTVTRVDDTFGDTNFCACAAPDE